MDRKLKIKVLQQGPNKDSQEERDCAAWLIENGYAEGTATPSHMHPDRRTLNVVWMGATEKGKAFANPPLLKTIIFSPYTVTIIGGLVVWYLTS